MGVHIGPWFRDRFLARRHLAARRRLRHVYEAIEHDNHDPDNTGLVLYAGIAFPLVALALYGLRERLQRREAGPRPA